VEPMSAPPNALRSGEDLARLSAQNPQTFTLPLQQKTIIRKVSHGDC